MHYTYIYYDPSRNNEPIYVGEGSKNRAWVHLRKKNKHPFVQRLQYMQKNNIKPVIGVYSGLDEEFAHLLEIELIAKFGRKDLGKGPLLNLTDGGEGQVNPSQEVRHKMSIAHLGETKTAEHKKKLSESCMGRIPWNKGINTGPESAETRNKKSIAKKGKPAHNKGTTHTEEYKTRQSLIMAEWWKTRKEKNNV
jgi:hypothetical protein